MHEYSIAYNIYSTAKNVAQDNGARRVLSVTVDIGELAMVNPEQVEFLFHAICEDDALFDGVDIRTRKIAVRSRCSCGYEGDERFVCPNCGALPEIIAGREIRVSGVQIEVNEE
ncbi:MAG: hydrogenase maturation nickel metallochaperone HypA/HybF [Methanoculleaceae archaeon]